MTTSSELVYSNDLCSAFLTAIVKAFETYHPKGYLGRTALQKLTYFVKVLGAPVPCSFGIYTYGPYSDKITFAVESLLADDVIEDNSPNAKYSSYRTGKNSKELLSIFASELQPHEDKVNQAVKALGSFSPSDLELISTLHFIARRQVQTVGKSSKQSAMREFMAIKKDKFRDDEISTWHDALVEAGLIVNLKTAIAL
jgi:uncharacterized protein YwgA